MLNTLKYFASTAAIALCAPVAVSAQDTKSAQTAAAIDPARLKQAEFTAKLLFPDGTYARMMDGMIDKMVEGIMGPMMDLKPSDFAGMINGKGEVDDAKLDAALKTQTIGEMAEKEDPHFRERMKIMMKVIYTEMTPVLTEIEPTLRSGIAKSLARRYTLAQLTDFKTFFSTPSGAAYARDSMVMYTDPEVIEASMTAVPKILEIMPGIMKKVEAATAHLPKLKNAAAEESDEGMEIPACASDGDTSDCSQDDKIAAELGLSLKDTGEEPWYDDSKWTAAERKSIGALSVKKDDAYSKYSDADANFANENYKIRSIYRAKYKAQGWTPPAPAATDAAKEAAIETSSK
jgi:hypothetical protein